MTHQQRIKNLTETGLFTALVFLGVFMFVFPTGFGYAHLGDCMIFLSVLMLGGKRGALAGGIGAALADLMSGYAIWILPTLFSKAAMALIMGAMISKKAFGLTGRTLWLVSAIFGGIVQSTGYTLARMVFYGMAPAVISIPGLLFQSGIGIVLAFVLSEALQKTTLRKHFIYTTNGKEVTELC